MVVFIVFGVVFIVAVAIAQPIVANQRRGLMAGAMVNGTQLTPEQVAVMRSKKPNWAWAWILFGLGVVLLAVGIVGVIV